jgi:hypothetical protein
MTQQLQPTHIKSESSLEYTGATALTSVGVSLSLLLWRHGIWFPILIVLLSLSAWLQARAYQARQAADAKPSVFLAEDANGFAGNRSEPVISHDANARRALWSALPPATEANEQVSRLVALTLDGLQWKSAEFQYTESPRLGFTRLQISVPTLGSYRAVRRALDLALLEMPNLSLDQLTMTLKDSEMPQLESRIRLSVWLRSPSPVFTESSFSR